MPFFRQQLLFQACYVHTVIPIVKLRSVENIPLQFLQLGGTIALCSRSANVFLVFDNACMGGNMVGVGGFFVCSLATYAGMGKDDM